jgi:hypothetical protein
MRIAETQKVRLSKKITSVVGSETPLRDLASNFSLVARSALNEANSLTIEKITIGLKRLPKNICLMFITVLLQASDTLRAQLKFPIPSNLICLF